jgi:hypothetical protein
MQLTTLASNTRIVKPYRNGTRAQSAGNSIRGPSSRLFFAFVAAPLCLLELPQKTFKVIRQGHVFHRGVIFLQMGADARPDFAVRWFRVAGRLIYWHRFGPTLHDANLGRAQIVPVQ